MTHAIDFVDKLLEELQLIRAQDIHSIPQPSDNKPLPDFVIKHWLNFAVYYERAAVSFIGGWLAGVKEVDALHHYTHQIQDECNHFRWLKKHQREYGEQYETFEVPKEWKFLMEEYYPSLYTLIDQLAAHNLAAETGALGFMEFNFHHFPPTIQKTLVRIIKEETYHVSFASKLLRKYCTTNSSQQQARRSALESLEHMQRAREVFVSI